MTSRAVAILLLSLLCVLGCDSSDRYQPHSLEHALETGRPILDYSPLKPISLGGRTVKAVWVDVQGRPGKLPFLVIEFTDAHIENEPRFHIENMDDAYYIGLHEISHNSFYEVWQIQHNVPNEIFLNSNGEISSFTRR